MLTLSAESGPELASPVAGGPGLISIAAFDRIRALVQARFGLKLEKNKRWMVSCRLQRLVREHGYGTVEAFCDRLLQGEDNPVIVGALVAHLTTNHTYFYRHPEQFELLRHSLLPEITARITRAGRGDIRVWCAAAATGEEPYALSMALEEHLTGPMATWQGGLIATDISPRALQTALRAEYTADGIKLLPPEWRRRFIVAQGDTVRVSDSVRAAVLFRRLNLMDPLPFRSPMHLIFCRNVLYYFDIATRHEVLKRMIDCLQPGGYIVLAPSERPSGLESWLKQTAAGVYKRV
jgi:chemotaxis protein methyltransferase CheR